MAKPPKRSQDDRPPSADAKPTGAKRSSKNTDAGLDPYFQLVLALIDAKDWRELEFRTGIRPDPQAKTPVHLSMLVGLSHRQEARSLQSNLAALRLEVPPVYFKLTDSESKLRHVTARIALDAGNPALLHNPRGEENVTTLRDHLEVILAENSFVSNLELAVLHQPCLEDSLQHIGLPVDRKFNGKVLNGSGVIVGVIDDGCAFAHRHFLKDEGAAGWGTRVLSLWDQTRIPTLAATAKGWSIPVDLNYGRELRKATIDAVIQNHTSGEVIAEDAVYAELGYTPGASDELSMYRTGDELSTHGTHVMDIAAGNGASLMGWQGVAPEADIVFVQLPPVDLLRPGPALSKAILDGMAYIFNEANKLNRPVVINLSLGGNHGPHDETWGWAGEIDGFLEVPNRAVVVAAGNGFEQDTHAEDVLFPGQRAALPWIVKAEDPTSNDVEIWYNGDAKLTVALTAPDGVTHYGPFAPGTPRTLLPRPGDGKHIGFLSHVKSASDKRALITLWATDNRPAGSNNRPASPGVWTIKLVNTGNKDARFDAWIQRDDLGKLGGRRQQSRFGPGTSYPGCTICDYASGKRTISVGAFNVATQEVSRYSACGPTRTRPTRPGRTKPDICAPAEEDVAGRGILSASSRQAQPTRMNGTSASAPHVAGLVALMLEYARYVGTPLTAEQILAGIIAAGKKGALQPNRHQIADARVPIKQQAVFGDLVGGGEIDFLATMDWLF